MKEDLAQLQEKLSAKQRRMARLLSQTERIRVPSVKKVMTLENEITQLEHQIEMQRENV